MSLIDTIFNEERPTDSNKAKSHIGWWLALSIASARQCAKDILTALLDGQLAYKVLGEKDPRPVHISNGTLNSPIANNTRDICTALPLMLPQYMSGLSLMTSIRDLAQSNARLICTALRRYATGDIVEALKLDNVRHSKSTELTVAVDGPYYLTRKINHAREVVTWCQAIDLRGQEVSKKD
ncbi:uncharacterized protein K460DRAFT_356845 [Cucurbitaria berberidis CBS 394.84]|uniref:Uncharacterized protein n=1 Tax=Cucurbitaria berberidis CBS 394.84 TaxID=1168544 RepID=A0A9P4L5U3_9PLEO|nr:uncharacterized protein K460DRAFT_356845 [Cucurbitaria berberidis CBS 394.84]KAF1843065.1 hypothetical protein K460DRAFT_356845 [Cucurbitaria berberidis CBS 394.84]